MFKNIHEDITDVENSDTHIHDTNLRISMSYVYDIFLLAKCTVPGKYLSLLKYTM